MPAWRSYLRSFIVLSVVVASVLGLVNVLGDNADVVAKAKEIACPRPACSMTRMERNPFAQTFEFQSTLGTVGVKCVRSSIFFGDYACSKQ
jgi:hypothetical protein